MQPDLAAVMRNFASGVGVVTAFNDAGGERVHDAVTVNSLSVVSLQPPLITLCLPANKDILVDILTATVFAVSILDSAAEDIGRMFDGPRARRAAALQTLSASYGDLTGALVLDAPSWLECELHDRFEVADHVLVVGRVVAAGTKDRRPPLIFLGGRYHVLENV